MVGEEANKLRSLLELSYPMENGLRFAIDDDRLNSAQTACHRNRSQLGRHVSRLGLHVL